MPSKTTIRASHFVRSLGRRGRTHLMACENKTLGVLKLYSPGDQERLILRVIASRIAQHVGIPTPEPTAIELPDFLLQHTIELSYARSFSKNSSDTIYPATLYGGLRDGESSDDQQLFELLPQSYLASLVNPQSFTHALAFDKWFLRPGSPKTLFSRSLTNKSYSVQFISGDRSFAENQRTFSTNINDGVYYQTSVYNCITGWDSFEPFLTKLIRITPETLHQTTLDLPFRLNNKRSAFVDCLIESLLSRRKQIRQAIEDSRRHNPDLFPAWPLRVAVGSITNPFSMGSTLSLLN